MDLHELNMNEREEGKAAAEEEFQYPTSVKVGVTLFSVLALLLVFWQMQTRIRLSVPVLGNGIQQAEQALSILEAEDEQLKSQDSDEDGLSDYHELRVYGSSPFISDGDSDGISDREEVANDTDPNCPEGTECGTPLLDTNNLGVQADLEVDEEITEIISSPAEIRRILKQGGMDPQLVDSLDDQSLQLLAAESLQIYQQQQPSQNIEMLQSLSPDALRDLLLSLGVTQQELDELSDEDLNALLSQLESQYNSGELSAENVNMPVGGEAEANQE